MKDNIIIQLLEKDIKRINREFNRLKKGNLNHNPKCPYSFCLSLDSVIIDSINGPTIIQMK
jgi:hypothetical protein